MKHVVLYVPGLGDKKRWLLWLQKQILKLWRPYGVRVEIITMKWAEDVPLKPRFEKLLDRIEELNKEGYKVSLVGVSAGASAVVSAFYLKPEQVAGVVTICGKLKGNIPDKIKEMNPCFAESLETLANCVEKLPKASRQRILTLRSLVDFIVPPAEAVIDGANNKRVNFIGHNPACGYVLLFKPRLITKFLKSA